MKKTIFFLIIAAAVGFGVVHGTSLVSAAASDNVKGFAWSDMPDQSDENKTCTDNDCGRGMGWISMNNISDATAIPYGVSIDQATGQWTGYGWSEYAGWINFNPSGPYPTQQGNNIAGGAKTDMVNGKTCGWAKALAGGTPQSGGWDGWISMCGSGSVVNPITNQTNITKFGVIVSPTSGAATLSGKAWGADVMGWIDFSQVTVNFNPIKTDGVCDPKQNKQPLASAPVAPLCTEGTATAITGSGPWKWQCKGINGGADAMCGTIPSINLTCTDGVNVYQYTDPLQVPAKCTELICKNTSTGVDVKYPVGTPMPAVCNGNPSGPTCDYSNGATSTTPPTPSCVTGIPSQLVTTSTGWQWACVVPPNAATCTITKNTPIKVCVDPTADSFEIPPLGANQIADNSVCTYKTFCQTHPTDPKCTVGPGGPLKPIYKEN